MSFLEDQIVSSSGSIVLIGQKTLFCVLSLIAQFCSFTEDVLIDWHVVPSHHYSLNWAVIVEAIKLMASDLRQSDPFVAGCQQAFQDVSGEGSDIIWNLVIKG